MLHPHLRVASVHEVTPELLEKADIRALLVDVDDTLLSSRADELEPNILKWFASLQAAGVRAAAEPLVKICAGCPIVAECRTWAEADEYTGIAAGAAWVSMPPVPAP